LLHGKGSIGRNRYFLKNRFHFSLTSNKDGGSPYCLLSRRIFPY
jgi:hypothetical protein